MVGTPSALASRSAHGFLCELHRGVFAPRGQLGTVLSLTLRDLGLLLDDLFLTLHCQLGPSASRRHCGLVSLVSSASQIGFRTGVNSSCSVCCSQDSSVSHAHIYVLNLLNSGGPTCIQFRARSHASRLIELPLLESV